VHRQHRHWRRAATLSQLAVEGPFAEGADRAELGAKVCLQSPFVSKMAARREGARRLLAAQVRLERSHRPWLHLRVEHDPTQAYQWRCRRRDGGRLLHPSLYLWMILFLSLMSLPPRAALSPPHEPSPRGSLIVMRGATASMCTSEIGRGSLLLATRHNGRGETRRRWRYCACVYCADERKKRRR
jgi:hypothetical protein